MRMNTDQELDARHVLNTYTEAELAALFRTYAEARRPVHLAQLIVQARAVRPLETTAHLVEALRPALPKHNDWDVLAPLFQAIRIEVNDEMGALRDLLAAAQEVLAPGGRLAVLSYHSLEDRLVKHTMKFGNFEGKAIKDFYGNLVAPFHLVTRKAVVAGAAEVAQNPRARSAKLRVAERAAALPPHNASTAPSS
jgi:16S rRNA (cytosine1402-N4)-methyltransferase